MEQKVDRLVGLFLQAELNEEAIEVIIDSETAYHVAGRLYLEFDRDFEIEEEYEFDRLLETEDILGVSMYFYEGESHYVLQSLIMSNGDTVYDESDKFYIHEDIIDDINAGKLSGEIVILKEDSESEEDELGDIFDDVSNDLVDEIVECIEEDDFCMHCAIKERLSEMYLRGYKQGLKTIRDSITDSLENME